MNALPFPLVQLYREMAEMTLPVCMERCPQAGGCCQPRYCDLASQRAGQLGLRLSAGTHPRLPYMGPTGCLVPPHLRPLCSVHVCEGALLQDPALARRYHALREAICQAEEALDLPWPEGLLRDYHA